MGFEYFKTFVGVLNLLEELSSDIIFRYIETILQSLKQKQAKLLLSYRNRMTVYYNFLNFSNLNKVSCELKCLLSESPSQNINFLLKKLLNTISFCLVISVRDIDDWKVDSYLFISATAFCMTLGFLLVYVFCDIYTETLRIVRIVHIVCAIIIILFYGLMASLLIDGISMQLLVGTNVIVRPKEYTSGGIIGLMATLLYIVELVYHGRQLCKPGSYFLNLE